MQNQQTVNLGQDALEYFLLLILERGPDSFVLEHSVDLPLYGVVHPSQNDRYILTLSFRQDALLLRDHHLFNNVGDRLDTEEFLGFCCDPVQIVLLVFRVFLVPAGHGGVC